MPKIFLHIGTEKTGTTYIQNVLFKSSDFLRDNNVIYPIGLIKEPNHVEMTTSYTSGDNIGLLRVAREPESFRARLKNFLMSHEEYDIIFSNEHLSSRIYKEEEIKSILHDLSAAGHSVKVIVYIRRPSSWLKSRYNEVVKSGFVGSFDDYTLMKKPLPSFDQRARNISQILELWRKCVGKDNFIAYKFEDAKELDLLEHFLSSTVGLYNPPNLSGVYKNESLSDLQINVLRMFNRIWGYTHIGIKLNRVLIRAVGIIQHSPSRNSAKSSSSGFVEWSEQQERAINDKFNISW